MGQGVSRRGRNPIGACTPARQLDRRIEDYIRISTPYGSSRDLDRRKRPVLRVVSLRIGEKALSLRDRAVKPGFGRNPPAGPTALSGGAFRGKLPADRTSRRQKNEDGSHETPSESGRDIRHLRIPLMIRPRYPHI
jgi:hypothetical protein